MNFINCIINSIIFYKYSKVTKTKLRVEIAFSQHCFLKKNRNSTNFYKINKITKFVRVFLNQFFTKITIIFLNKCWYNTKITITKIFFFFFDSITENFQIKITNSQITKLLLHNNMKLLQQLSILTYFQYKPTNFYFFIFF